MNGLVVKLTILKNPSTDNLHHLDAFGVTSITTGNALVEVAVTVVAVAAAACRGGVCVFEEGVVVGGVLLGGVVEVVAVVEVVPAVALSICI